jgi:hypothetical protein
MLALPLTVIFIVQFDVARDFFTDTPLKAEQLLSQARAKRHRIFPTVLLP